MKIMQYVFDSRTLEQVIQAVKNSGDFILKATRLVILYHSVKEMIFSGKEVSFAFICILYKLKVPVFNTPITGCPENQLLQNKKLCIGPG